MTSPIDIEKNAPGPSGARLPALGSPELSTSYIAKIKEIIEILLGRRGGSNWDRAVTFRDLVDMGLSGTAEAGGTLTAAIGGQPAQVITPGGPSSGSIENAIRNSASYKRLMTRIGSVEDLANFPEEIRLQLETSISDLARQRQADIQTLQRKQQTAQTSFASQLTEVTAAVKQSDAGVRQFVSSYADDKRAIALDISQLSAELGDVGNINIEERLQALADSVMGLQGQYTIKIQANPVNGKPVFAGIDLAVTSPIDGPGTSSILFLAEEFAFVTNGGEAVPFSIAGQRIRFNGDVLINGRVVLGDGVPLDINYAPSGTLNNAISLDSNGRLQGGGGGQVQNLPVVDGARNVNYAPRDYGVVHVKEFKEQIAIGIPNSPGGYCTLETMKPWLDNSGGNATQWAYAGDQTWRRTAPCAADSWGPWVRDLDRNIYLGDLNATFGAPAGTNVGNTPATTVESNASNALTNAETANQAAYNAYLFAGQANDAAGAAQGAANLAQGTANMAQGTASGVANQIPGLTAAIAAKLAKDGSDTITGQIGLQSQYALLVGTATNGVWMGSGGIFMVQNGVVKASLPISGNPTFAGQLIAAFGSFGAISIAAGGYLTLQAANYGDPGIFLGFVGTTPKFSIVAANGAKLLYDPSDSQPLKLVNVAQASDFSIGITNTLNQYYWNVGRNNTSGYAGAYVAGTANGSGSYSYSWSVSTAGSFRVWIGGSTTSQQVAITVAGGGLIGEFDVYISCTVTDLSTNISKTTQALTVVNFQ